MTKRYIELILAGIPAVIMLQTLLYKFTGDPLSVHIFSTLGVEPWGRYLVGFSELLAGILLLLPATRGLGALIGVGAMSGAIMAHLLFLGIDVQGDGGTLFYMALMVLVFSAIVAVLKKDQLFGLLAKLLKR